MGAPAAGASLYNGTPMGNRDRQATHLLSITNAGNATQTHPESLEATYTSLIQEYLQVMCLENATFLAERMVASCRSVHAWYLLGVCHYRSNAPQRALSVLEHNGAFLKEHPPTAYLAAQCCFQLQQYERVEEVLLETARSEYREYKGNYHQQMNTTTLQEENKGPMTMDEWMLETSPCPIPNGAAGLYLLGNACRRSNRKRRAMEYYRMSLQLDPLMWVSYEALCELGAVNIDPTTIFGVRPAAIDQLQERFQQRNAVHDEMPLQEKSVLTPHHFTPPTHGAGVGVTGANRSIDLGTPNAASIGPKASLFQTVQKVNAEPNSAAILPNQLQFDTPNLTPIPMQHDASFIHQHQSHHQTGSVGVTFQQSSILLEADIPLNHVFGDSLNPHTVRRAKYVAARLYYQPSPETRPYDRFPTDDRFHSNAVETSRDAVSRRYLRGKSALHCAVTSRIDLEPTISETPVRRGGRPSDVSTVRRPRALFLSENKAMRENTNDRNRTNSSTLDDEDDDENHFRPLISRGQEDGVGGDHGMDDENHPDDEQSNMIIAEENVTNGANAGQQSNSLTEDEKSQSFTANLDQVRGELDDEEMRIEKQGAVQEILELLCLLGAGYWRLCQFRCREALQLFSALPQVQHNTGWVLHQEGRTYFEMADYQKAQRCLEMMQRVEPHRMKGLELLSTVLWQLKKEVDLAHLAQRAVDFDRLSPEAWCVVGNCFSLQKEHETALVFFGRSLQLDSSFTYTHTLSGYEYMANEDFEKAMTCFRNAIRSDERHYNAWYGMGAIYHRQEKYDLAEYHFHRAVQINPQSSVLRCNLGMSQYSNGKPIQALHTLSEAFRLDPHNPQARFQRATIYLALNRPEEALEELKKVRDAAPREATVHFSMGKVLKRLGRPEQAMRCFLTALDLDPKDNQLIKSAMDKLEEPDILDEEVTTF